MDLSLCDLIRVGSSHCFYDFQLDLIKMMDLRTDLDLEVEHQDLTCLCFSVLSVFFFD